MTAQDRHREGVVLLHGFGALPGTMWRLASSLSACGYATLTPFYPSWRMPLDRLADRLSEPIRTFANGLDGPVHFVGHSMGGLIIRALLHRYRPAQLGRVVMLGTPNGGSELADLLWGNTLSRFVLGQAGPTLVTRRDERIAECLGVIDFPMGVIAGNRPMVDGPLAKLLPRPHDGKVSVAATHVEGESDHLVLPVTHMLLPFDARVRRQTLHFLQHGEFDRTLR